MKILHGRIVDTWQEDSASWMELVVRDERRLLRMEPQVGVGARPGDIVEATIGEDGTVLALTSAGAPELGAWDAAGDGLRWRRFGDAPSRLALLSRRDRMIRAIRGHFQDQGFLEVQAPLLVKGACPDPHIHSFRAGDHYLSTSTEYQLKRLIVGGVEKVFTLTQNFRAGDLGPRHNPEFTMLEWARAFETIETIEQDAIELVIRALDAVEPGADKLWFGEHEVMVRGVPWERLTVRDALREHLGMEVDPDFSPESLHRECERTKQRAAERFSHEPHAIVSALIDSIAPMLGTSVPVFLRDWPAFMTSSAEAGAIPGIADRSELFIAGIEVSDGFPALRDAAAQRAAFNAALARRRHDGAEPVALDEAYLSALEQGMPPAAGMALGIDRLAMVILDEAEIRRVLPFSWDEL
jgi:elongation factor P--(R)-beta-lysine ligase